jgi:hypothetical protein
MRFVDQQHDALAPGVALDQRVLQGAGQRVGGLAIGRNAQFVGDGTEDFLARQRGIGQVQGFDIGGRRSSSMRQSMVLPLPTSPVTLTMPSSWVMA